MTFIPGFVLVGGDVFGADVPVFVGPVRAVLGAVADLEPVDALVPGGAGKLAGLVADALVELVRAAVRTVGAAVAVTAGADASLTVPASELATFADAVAGHLVLATLGLNIVKHTKSILQSRLF